MRCLLGLTLLFVGRQETAVRAQNSICTSDTNTFTVKVNLFAGEMGYFQFEECGNMTSPTIGLEVGETYSFVQKDVSNYYHPMGFAYFPDGAHADKDELEPTISQTGSACTETASCPAPMYFIGEKYVGNYSNNAEVAPVTAGEGDFGLDAYEPLFFYPLGEWVSNEPFNIKLRFDDANYTQDLFYFCHIHEFMSGRIKLLKDGVPVNSTDGPALGYEYDVISDFDEKCGTYNLEKYQLPNSQCPATFVCGAEDASETVQQYSECWNAMDCHMFAGMTSGVSLRTGAEEALFVHQMIPHHENAVNMAKALLKSNVLVCDDLAGGESADCTMETISRSIINSQNYQIQLMDAYLSIMGFPATDDCEIEISSKQVAAPDDGSAGTGDSTDEGSTDSGDSTGTGTGTGDSTDTPDSATFPSSQGSFLWTAAVVAVMAAVIEL